jgi:phage terminase small subunit
MALTAREEKFCQEYIIKLDKTKAAIAAGYSQKSARNIGYENMTKPHILHRIAEIRLEIKEKLGVDEHSVLAELATLAFWNIKDFITDKNSIRDLSKMSKAKLKAVIGIKVKEVTYSGSEDNPTKEITTELKFSDKRAALTDLGRHLGIFKEDNNQKAIKIKVSRK